MGAMANYFARSALAIRIDPYVPVACSFSFVYSYAHFEILSKNPISNVLADHLHRNVKNRTS